MTSLRLQSTQNEKFVLELSERYAKIAKEETRYEAKGCEGAEVIISAFGTTARIASSAARKLQA
ncbi:MAG TPA: hypothetical protein PLN93_08535, partial [Vicinamibacterales bacterium]|nr:hypothetical protein [Vicinamibacterales bacterium]